MDRDANGQVHVERRRDGKYDVDSWPVSTDGQAIFIKWDVNLLDLLYGHIWPHKEGKGELLRQEIYGVQEAFGSTIMMQFDMPQEANQMLDSCTKLKKGKRY